MREFTIYYHMSRGINIFTSVMTDWITILNENLKTLEET